jgi:hypothetical protein
MDNLETTVRDKIMMNLEAEQGLKSYYAIFRTFNLVSKLNISVSYTNKLVKKHAYSFSGGISLKATT